MTSFSEASEPARPSGVELRPEVASLPAYVPGARPAPGAKIHKLSSNENPFPPLPSVVAQLTEVLGDINRYPDMAATDLLEALAEHLNGAGVGGAAAGAARALATPVVPDNIAVGTGSAGVLGDILACVVRPGDEVIYPWRSFEAYPLMVAIAGGVSVQVPLAADLSIDVRALADAVTDKTRVILVCTPNNPTGPAVTHQEVIDLLESVPSHVLVVVDEAYLEFVRQDGAVDGVALLADYPNALVLRTFSKAYGLAGLRVGYAVGAPEVISGIRSTATPFGVSTLAQRAGVLSLTAYDELLERVDVVVQERTRVVAALADQGWDIPDTQANFVYFPVEDRALEFGAAATAAGILVRPFDGYGVRVSLGDHEANDALIALAESWIKSSR